MKRIGVFLLFILFACVLFLAFSPPGVALGAEKAKTEMVAMDLKAMPEVLPLEVSACEQTFVLTKENYAGLTDKYYSTLPDGKHLKYPVIAYRDNAILSNYKDSYDMKYYKPKFLIPYGMRR